MVHTLGEVRAVLERMDAVEGLVAELICGSGLRLMEALRVRVKDLDFERKELSVRDGKGSKDRRTMLPVGVGERLRHHLQGEAQLHANDLAEGYGRVELPEAPQIPKCRQEVDLAMGVPPASALAQQRNR